MYDLKAPVLLIKNYITAKEVQKMIQMKYVHGIPLIQGDVTNLHQKIGTDYFRRYRYPHFPSTMIASSESDIEEDALYHYPQASWKRLFWHGAASKHQMHYTWCLNRLLQSGAKLTVRQYLSHVDSAKRRISILSIRYLSHCCSVQYVNDRQKVLSERRVPGLDPNDYQIVLSGENHLEDMILQDNQAQARRRSDEEWDHFPPRDDPADPQQPFDRTITSQCVWLHRLCQVSPGTLSLENGFRLYGAMRDNNQLSLVGIMSKGHLQRKFVPLNTPIHACDPCSINNGIDDAYTILQG